MAQIKTALQEAFKAGVAFPNECTCGDCDYCLFAKEQYFETWYSNQFTQPTETAEESAEREYPTTEITDEETAEQNVYNMHCRHAYIKGYQANSNVGDGWVRVEAVVNILEAKRISEVKKYNNYGDHVESMLYDLIQEIEALTTPKPPTP